MFFLIVDNAGILWHMIVQTGVMRKIQFIEEWKFCCKYHDASTLSQDKMAAIVQTIFSNAFSGMEMYEFWLRSHWSLFLSVQLTILQHWFRWWLGAGQVTNHCLNQWWSIYWHIYVSLGLKLMDLELRVHILLLCSWLKWWMWLFAMVNLVCMIHIMTTYH